MLAFNWVFRTKYCCGRSQVRGKPSSIGFPYAKVVKRSETWNCTHLRFRSVYLGLAKQRQRRKRRKQPKRGPARQWLQRYSRGGSKWWQQKARREGSHPTNVKLCKAKRWRGGMMQGRSGVTQWVLEGVREKSMSWVRRKVRRDIMFFCWRLLGLVPGGALFSQLSSGVRDAMVVSTKLVKCHFVTKTCIRPIETTHKRGWDRKPSTESTRTAKELTLVLDSLTLEVASKAAPRSECPHSSSSWALQFATPAHGTLWSGTSPHRPTWAVPFDKELRWYQKDNLYARENAIV